MYFYRPRYLSMIQEEEDNDHTTNNNTNTNTTNSGYTTPRNSIASLIYESLNEGDEKEWWIAFTIFSSVYNLNLFIFNFVFLLKHTKSSLNFKLMTNDSLSDFDKILQSKPDLRKYFIDKRQRKCIVDWMETIFSQ